MDATADELAGVVDMFGGLTREELERALSEAAFRADGQSVDADAVDEAIEAAVETFALVEYRPEDADRTPDAPDRNDGDPDADERGSDGDEPDPLYVAGPTAFPTTPQYAEDLPHILETEPRILDREALGAQVRDRFERAVEETVADGDAERAGRLLDVSYDLEAWAPVSVESTRGRLDELDDGDGDDLTTDPTHGRTDAAPE